MSEVESHVGTLVKIGFRKGMTTEEKAKEVCKKWFRKTELEPCYTDWTEYLQEEGYKEFVIVNGEIYHILSDRELSDEDIFYAEENKDGTISYTLRYYNGGCCFSSAVETALRQMQKRG
jgi:hypothetical protein